MFNWNKDPTSKPANAFLDSGSSEPVFNAVVANWMVGRLKTILAWVVSSWNFLVHRQSVPPERTAGAANLVERLPLVLDHQFRSGLRVLILVLGVTGIWAICVPLSAAVIMPGTLVVQSRVKEIQHPTGGVVAQILVHDGEHVNQGDLLVRLDETQ